MADQIDPSKLKAAELSMKKASELSDILAKQASEATGEVAKHLDRMAALFDSMSKNSAEVLESEKKLKKIQEERLKAYKELESLKGDANKKERAQIQQKLKNLRDEANAERANLELKEKQIDAQKKYVTELGKSKNLLGEFFSNGKTQLLGYLASSAQLTKALLSMSKAVQDVADISIQSGTFFGMTGDFVKDFKDIGSAAVSYAKQSASVTYEMAKLGIATEEGAQAFKEFSQVVKNPGTAQAAESMRDLTVVTGQLSKVLGVSMPEATEFMIESQLKFNRTAQQSASAMYSVFTASEKYNRELGQTVIRGRDVSKVIFDLARESKAAAQDQELLSKMISSNLLRLQGQGQNYREALEGASLYIRKMTTDAPDWMKILSGRQLLNTFGTLGQNLSAEMAKQLDAARPGLSDRVKKILTDPSLSSYAKQGLLQEALEGTQVGLDAMQSQLSTIIKRAGPQALSTIQAVYGVSQQEAYRLMDQNKAWQEQTTLRNKILDSSKSAKEVADEYNKGLKDSDKITEATIENIRKLKDEDLVRSMIAERSNQESSKSLEDQKNKEAALALQKEENRKKELASKKQLLESTEDEGLKRALQKRIVELEGEPVKGISEKLDTNLKGYMTAAGSQIKGAFDVITKTTAGQLASAALGFLILQKNGRDQLRVLSEIRDSLRGSMGSGGGMGGESGGLLDKLSKKIPKTKAGKVLGSALKVGGKFAPGILQAGYGLLTNYDTISEQYKKEGLGGAAKEAVASTLGKVGVGTAVGSAIGSIIPGAGTLIGGIVGSVADSMLDLPTIGDVYKALDEKGVIATPTSSVPLSPEAPSAMNVPGQVSGMAQEAMRNINLNLSRVSTSQGPKLKATAEVEFGSMVAEAQSYASMGAGS